MRCVRIRPRDTLVGEASPFSPWRRSVGVGMAWWAFRMRKQVGPHSYQVPIAGMLLVFGGVALFGVSLGLLLRSPFRMPMGERLFRVVWLGPIGRVVHPGRRTRRGTSALDERRLARHREAAARRPTFRASRRRRTRTGSGRRARNARRRAGTLAARSLMAAVGPGRWPRKPRETFASRFGTLMTIIGVAIGLGNVWRFPYMVGKFGGAAFVLFYVLVVRRDRRAGADGGVRARPTHAARTGRRVRGRRASRSARRSAGSSSSS